MLNNGELDGAQILKKETAKSMHEDQLGSVPYPWGPMTFGLVLMLPRITLFDQKEPTAGVVHSVLYSG
jgi:hypothetical protein